VERSGETLCHRGETKHHSSLAAAKPLKVAGPEAMSLSVRVVAGCWLGGLVGGVSTRRNKTHVCFLDNNHNRRVIFDILFGFNFGKGFDNGKNGSRWFFPLHKLTLI